MGLRSRQTMFMMIMSEGNQLGRVRTLGVTDCKAVSLDGNEVQ